MCHTCCEVSELAIITMSLEMKVESFLDRPLFWRPPRANRLNMATSHLFFHQNMMTN
jgi:hypothetical protein